MAQKVPDLYIRPHLLLLPSKLDPEPLLADILKSWSFSSGLLETAIMQLRKHMLLVLWMACQTLASVAFTSPAAGTVIPGASFTVAWQDNGAAPSISDLTTYTLELWTGSNTNPVSPLSTSPPYIRSM